MTNNTNGTNNGSTYTDATQNPTSTYYLHPSNQANNKLVPTIFNGTNYGKWMRSLTLALSAKNKIGFIDGSFPKTLGTSQDHKAWDRCNDIVIGWIISSLDDSILQSVFYRKVGEEIWIELEERYGLPSSTHLYSLQEKLFSLKHTEGVTVAEFFTQVKTIWDEMDNMITIPTCNCCNDCEINKEVLKIQTDQQILHFLKKIDDRFEHVRSNILMMPKLPGVSQVYCISQQEETHKQISKQHHIEPVAFLSSKRQFQEKESFNTTNLHSSKGYSRQYKYLNNGNKQPPFCDHCKNSGHTINKCFKLHGYNQIKTKEGKLLHLCVLMKNLSFLLE